MSTLNKDDKMTNFLFKQFKVKIHKNGQNILLLYKSTMITYVIMNFTTGTF